MLTFLISYINVSHLIINSVNFGSISLPLFFPCSDKYVIQTIFIE